MTAYLTFSHELYITPIDKIQLQVFGIEAKLLQVGAAVIGKALFARSVGPAIFAAGVLKEEPTLIGKDQDRLRKGGVGNITHHLALDNGGKGGHAVGRK